MTLAAVLAVACAGPAAAPARAAEPVRATQPQDVQAHGGAPKGRWSDGVASWILMGAALIVGAVGGSLVPIRRRPGGRRGAAHSAATAPARRADRATSGSRQARRGVEDVEPLARPPSATPQGALALSPAAAELRAGRSTAPLWAPRAAAQPLQAPIPLPLPSKLPPPRERIWPRISPAARRWALAGVLVAGAALRIWHIDAVGLNSDEAVYAGQGASIAGDPALSPFFPTFRAHPLLFQSLVSVGYLLHVGELFGRLAAAALGVATIYVTYCLGRMLYGTRAGLIAGAILALMPFHVVVTRQILLDGPRTLMATVTLYLLARFALTERIVWFHASAAALGLTFLCKEDSVIMVGSFYAFLALTPWLRTGLRHVVLAGVIFLAIAAALPVSLDWAGHTGTGGHFLAWQLFRPPNHSLAFYPAVVPAAIGLGVVVAAALGLWLLRRERSWRETLLVSWIAVPICFFELFPVKGFQYLLPIAPAVAVLAARFLAHWDPRTLPGRTAVPMLHGRRTRRLASSFSFLATRRTMPLALLAVLISLAVPSWQRVQPSHATTFLAGSGGLPGGRAAGRWIAAHVPKSAQMMSIGPSMANVLQFYGHRRVYGLSVSPNPLHRNPVYEAMRNPDLLIRNNELQYIVWDAFSAGRSPYFAHRMRRYVERYHGHVAHTETVPVRSPSGAPVRVPVIVIYEVSP